MSENAFFNRLCLPFFLLMGSILPENRLCGAFTKINFFTNDTQHIYLFSDDHSIQEPHVNQEQLKAVKALLDKYETSPTMKCLILAEIPATCGLGSLSNRYTILAALPFIFNSLKLNNTTLKNYEIRTTTIPVIHLIQRADKNLPIDNLTYYTQNIILTSNNITFNDIITEYTTWFTAITALKNSHPAKTTALFDEKLEDSKEFFEQFNSFLHDNNINESTLVINAIDQLAHRVYEQGPNAFYRLEYLLHDMINPLLDLWFFHHLINARDYNSLIVMAGGYHATVLTALLFRAGYCYKGAYNAKDCYLKESEFDLNTLLPSSLLKSVQTAILKHLSFI
ncbi:hypothetical protein H0X48_05040 [Candidatus Dependentiae bacterium]|nr:hypothetical protein [Candidatus Dependentiae bacterium]